jgi:thiol-disulfide isomerase/thioredoxin
LAGATLDGPALDAAALEGNTVLVNFWATWCDPCVREMPALQAVYDRHRADGFVVVGLLAGDRASDERVREFTRRMGVTYPVLRSSTEQQRRFEMRDSLPMSLLYDKTGRLRRRFEGGIKEHVLEGEVKEILR